MSREYNYSSRKELIHNFLETNKPSKLLFGLENKRVFDELMGVTNSEAIRDAENEIRKSGQPPAEYLKKKYSKLVKFCVTNQQVERFYGFLNKYNQFSYSRGMGRRTVRTKSYAPGVYQIFPLLKDYYIFQMFNCSLVQYLQNDLSEELLDLKYNLPYGYQIYYLDNRIAAGIDSGEQGVKEAIIQILLGDNNTAAVTVDIIRGIIKSSDKELHKLLGDFLLAARLQEGVRQAICENMDCGVEDAFLTLFDVVYQNDLARYSSVRRAVSTWIGLGDGVNEERIIRKILENMHKCLEDAEEVNRYLAGEDAIEIMIALWTLGSREVLDAIEAINQRLIKGSRQQKLAASYYNISLEYKDFTERVAINAIAENPKDYELIAAYFPTYLSHIHTILRDITNDSVFRREEKIYYHKIEITRFYDTREEGENHFAILKDLLEEIPKKELVFSPCLFPWYAVSLSKSEVVERLCVIAYSLEDQEKIDYVVQYLPLLSSQRPLFLALLLHEPATPIQRKCLLQAVADKETYTRKRAFELVEEMKLTAEDYEILCSMLRYKATDIRRNIISLLLKCEEGMIQGMLKDLLMDKKEEIRLAGLDILMQLEKQGDRTNAVLAGKACLKEIEKPSSREQILIGQIEGGNENEEVLAVQLYQAKDVLPKPQIPVQKSDYPLFQISKSKLKGLFQALDNFIDLHREETLVSADGTEYLLGNCRNGLPNTNYGWQKPLQEKVPLVPLWIEFYEQYVKNFPDLLAMFLSICPCMDEKKLKNGTLCEKQHYLILGEAIVDMDISGYTYGPDIPKGFSNIFMSVIQVLMERYEEKEYVKETGEKLGIYLLSCLPEKGCWYERVRDKNVYYYRSNIYCFTESSPISYLLKCYQENWSEQEFEKRFWLLHGIDMKFAETKLLLKQDNNYSRVEKLLNAFDYVKAFQMGIIQKEQMYLTFFEQMKLDEVLRTLGTVYQEKQQKRDAQKLSAYGLAEGEGLNEELLKIVKEVYNQMVDRILDVECKRGDTPTVFSHAIGSIDRVFGTKRLVDLLLAMGNETFNRSGYYYWGRDDSKSYCLSHLIHVCYPMKGEDEKTLGELLKGTGIKEKRLVEVAMYAPQWLNILEKYLDYPGLTSGCYYFMAHMNERFDDRKAAMIAKYTPLTQEELNQGAFDLNWFWEAYNLLGEKNFDLLYHSAKYISDGNKHSRGRKYADAALGRVTTGSLEAVITEKRNKDLLMSYGLIPLKGKKDMLRRYDFIQKFLKESKQFGAQRRASEGSASSVALKNLSISAGYQDVTRLTLAMEMELMDSMKDYFEWKSLDEKTEICLVVNQMGKAEIVCRKNDKKLAAVPAAFKKDSYVLSMKEVHKKLKEQYARTVKMFEGAMEEREIYQLDELLDLQKNPVTAPIVNNLVFISEVETEGDNPIHGLLFAGDEGVGLKDETGILKECLPERKLRVAHPYDLYQAGSWSGYQKLFFYKQQNEGSTQPFRQVFRELYVKLAEELEMEHSMLFAGNQIQPKKTLACLKGRRWIADYEEGLQKVCYKDNIVAQMYALADWFSPGDIEAPALEWVVFYDRKTFRTLKLLEVPDIVYSEVMRDVDLAVSVAHAGSVDPESSHSTIEMRRVIVMCNLELFGLNNVRLDGNYAMVSGERGEYSIHLGSGVIHKMGSHQIQVLPVHSQRRGRIFLPFLDEDPKTAEIVSKILLFAEDKKIKDPYILQQIIN